MKSSATTTLLQVGFDLPIGTFITDQQKAAVSNELITIMGKQKIIPKGAEVFSDLSPNGQDISIIWGPSLDAYDRKYNKIKPPPPDDKIIDLKLWNAGARWPGIFGLHEVLQKNNGTIPIGRNDLEKEADYQRGLRKARTISQREAYKKAIVDGSLANVNLELHLNGGNQPPTWKVKDKLGLFKNVNFNKTPQKKEVKKPSIPPLVLSTK